MKLKTCHSAFFAVVFLTLLLPLGAIAQDDRLTGDSEFPNKETLKQDPETPSGPENPEARAGKNSTTPVPLESPVIIRETDPKTVKAAAKLAEKVSRDEEKVQKDEEEDPLSFNFLYYIIEKFKFNDIVE